MTSKARNALTFGIYRHDVLVHQTTVLQDIVKVGTDPRSHLRIDDDLAARMHAVIEVAGPDDITLIDLGSETGSVVNGVRVQKCRIVPSDQILIGTTRIVLERVEPLTVATAVPTSKPPELSVGPARATPSVLPNPFLAQSFASDLFGNQNPNSPNERVDADAPEGTYTYEMCKAGLPVASDEVESTAISVEVLVMWGQSVLHVAHLTPPRAFYVGEEADKGLRCDYFVPSEKLGTTRAPIVLADAHSVSAVLLPHASGTIEVDGQAMTLQEAVDGGRTQPCAELSGAAQVLLPVGAKARIRLDNGLTFQVSTVHAGRVVAGHANLDPAAVLYMAMSLVTHASLFLAMFFFFPALDSSDEGEMSADQQYILQQMLSNAAEKELEEKETEQVAEDVADEREGGKGRRASNEEGAMGTPNTNQTGHRYAVKGHKDNLDPHLARQAALHDAANSAMIGLVSSIAGGDPDAPTAPWGRDESLGNDALSARGNMWGDTIGESFGRGGLGLSGIGEGGGGRGEGIGFGNFGGLGHGAGLGDGQGFGAGSGRLMGSHRVRVPGGGRPGVTTVSGRLPPEVIQRIVRQNFGRFRLCYENGLRTSPNLMGRVAVSFVIGRDGSVGSASNGGSDLPDGGVVSCVVRAFYGLSFPQPEGGVVKVTYPIMFTPGA